MIHTCKRVPKFNNNNNNNIYKCIQQQTKFDFSQTVLHGRFMQSVFCVRCLFIGWMRSWQQHIPHINKRQANTISKREMCNRVLLWANFYVIHAHTRTLAHTFDSNLKAIYIHSKSNKNHKFGGSFCVWLAPLIFVSIFSRFIYIFRFHGWNGEFSKFLYSFIWYTFLCKSSVPI